MEILLYILLGITVIIGSFAAIVMIIGGAAVFLFHLAVVSGQIMLIVFAALFFKYLIGS